MKNNILKIVIFFLLLLSISVTFAARTQVNEKTYILKITSSDTNKKAPLSISYMIFRNGSSYIVNVNQMTPLTITAVKVKFFAAMIKSPDPKAKIKAAIFEKSNGTKSDISGVGNAILIQDGAKATMRFVMAQ